MQIHEFIGDRLRRLRTARRLSLMAVQRLSGVSWSTLYRCEVGGVLTRRTAERLAPVLGVEVEALLPDAPASAAAPRPPEEPGS